MVTRPMYTETLLLLMGVLIKKNSKQMDTRENKLRVFFYYLSRDIKKGPLCPKS